MALSCEFMDVILEASIKLEVKALNRELSKPLYVLKNELLIDSKKNNNKIKIWPVV